VFLAAALLALLLKPLLAWRMLHDEVMAVEVALGQSLPAGRAQLSRLVSRDVSALTAVQVRESAIESLAENLNDSVVAPLFWFALLGLPGAALYRFANTADAMWGYPGMRGGRYWQWAGKWAARADDVLSWVPARITALLMAAGAKGLPLRSLARQARKTPSPNSGWPMAAMALALGVRLAKPGVYTLNSQGRRAGPLDTRRAARMGSQVVLALVPLVVAIQLMVLGVVSWLLA
ncbi:MAG: adenosylcobinamide-phosphate synthase CbiB, partial [Gammaproteobacteria bacterium]|nr:adenosylcobinamide-phosphate synthase CbiB [Gammaproteobacteria bacterium]